VSFSARHTKRTVVAQALMTLSATVSLCASSAFAQDSQVVGEYTKPDQVVREIMRSEAARGGQLGRGDSSGAISQKFTMRPLPGDQGFADSSEQPGKFQPKGSNQIPDFGPDTREEVNVSLPPMRGLRQILNSQVTADLITDLTKAKANVLLSTYMMVENGAATGFMGGVNIGQNLMSNMLEAQDAQMRMLDVVDPKGQAKEAYVRQIANLMKNSSGNQNVWPAAIYMAAGEDGKKPKQDEMKDLREGQQPYNFKNVPHAGSQNEENKRLLSDILFVEAKSGGGGGTITSNSTTPDNQKISQLKTEFVKLVGDVQMEIKNPTELSRTVEYKYVAPEEKQNRRGVSKTNWEEVQVVWESIHNILGDVCDYYVQNPNARRDIDDKLTLMTYSEIGKERNGASPWELASAPDIPMSINVIKMLFSYIDKNENLETINCDQSVRLKAKNIPMNDAATGTKVNDCTGTNGCIRKKVVLQLSYLIARSKTYHTYGTLYGISKKFATDPDVSAQVEELFGRTLADIDIQQEISLNQAEYREFISFLAKLVKGDIGAGTVLRGGHSSMPKGQKVGGTGL
jgi:hypothetical protein